MRQITRRCLAAGAMPVALSLLPAAAAPVTPDAELLELCTEYGIRYMADELRREAMTEDQRRDDGAARVSSLLRGEELPDQALLRCVASTPAQTATGIRVKAQAIALSYYGTTEPPLSLGIGVPDKLLLSLLADLRGSAVA